MCEPLPCFCIPMHSRHVHHVSLFCFAFVDPCLAFDKTPATPATSSPSSLLFFSSLLCTFDTFDIYLRSNTYQRPTTQQPPSHKLTTLIGLPGSFFPSSHLPQNNFTAMDSSEPYNEWSKHIHAVITFLKPFFNDWRSYVSPISMLLGIGVLVMENQVLLRMRMGRWEIGGYIVCKFGQP